MFSHCCRFLVPLACLLGLLISPARAEQALEARPVVSVPEIDGLGNDPAWEHAMPVITHDVVADIDIELRAVYSGDQVYIMVRYPDADESRYHRSWFWDAEQMKYTTGGDREDALVLKWQIAGDGHSLSIYSDHPYHADIWYWKACRTDPVGFADDKFQILESVPSSRSQEVSSVGGQTMYLKRMGDEGTSSYATEIPGNHEGDRIPRFTITPPTGNRADIRARGCWADGWWVIEFSRALRTGYKNDVELGVGERHFFGVSRYEIAARPEDPRSEVPLFGSGDVGERLYLNILK